MTDYIVVLITAPKEDEAVHIAKTLVEERLAACVNVIRDIRSLYRWEGKVEDDKEVLMVVKSRKDLFRDLVKRVKGLHSYSVPEIIAVPIADGIDEYLKWLHVETG